MLFLGWLASRYMIPALLFRGAYVNGIPAAVSWQALASFYLPFLLLFFCAYRLYQPRHDASTFALGSVYSNTAFVGIPVIVQSFGSSALQYVFPVIVFHSLLAFSLYYLHATGEQIGWNKWLSAFKTTIANPIVSSLLFGLLVNLLNIPLPAIVLHILQYLGQAALVCALLSLGASLSGFRVQALRSSMLLTLNKLVLLPGLVAFCALFVFELPKQMACVLIVMSACPVGINAYSVVLAHRGTSSLLSSAILLSSAFCALSLPVWLGLLTL